MASPSTSLLLITLFLINPTSQSRILCIFPTPFYSHQSVFQQLWAELSSKGHQVTVITTNPLNNSSLTNLTEIDLGFTYKLVFDDLKMDHVINTEHNIFILMGYQLEAVRNMTIEQFRHRGVQELLRSEDSFDLVLAEAHMASWFGFASKFKCPLVLGESMEAQGHWQRTLGNINHPVLNPNIDVPYVGQLTLFQRIYAVFYEGFFDFHMLGLTYPVQQKIAREFFNDHTLDLFEMRRNVSLLISNVIPGFTTPSLMIPSMVYLNGLHIRPPQPLESDLQEFLDGANRGAIYFSLGSTVKSVLEVQQVFEGVFAELPFRVIWKGSHRLASGANSSKIKMVAWAPQQDVLRHPNVRLFITQGGRQSTEEGIVSRVPMLAIGVLGDQLQSALKIARLGIGRALQLDYLGKEEIKEAILDLINNDRYKHKLEQMAEIPTQGSSKSIQKAIDWIEYVIEFKGAPHLKSPMADMPYYQYYLIDVLLFLFVITMSLLFALYKIVKLGGRLANKIKFE